MTEIWRPCPGYETAYEVSSFGRVRSLHFSPPRIIACVPSKDGYPIVSLSKDGKRTPKRLHRLVCRAFHGEPFSIWNEAAHLDGDRANARSDNLKWVNRVENHHHQRAHGTHMAGERHPRAKLTAAQASEIKASTEHRGIVARRFGISVNTVTDIRSGRRWAEGIAQNPPSGHPHDPR